MRTHIDLDDKHPTILNWSILYSHILSPEEPVTREDITLYTYNNWLCKRGRRLTTLSCEEYEDPYEMLFSFINDYNYGIKNEVRARRDEAVITGSILIALKSLVYHKSSKEPSMSLARYLYKSSMDEAQKKSESTSKSSLLKKTSDYKTIMHYCAALAVFDKIKDTKNIPTKDGFAKFLALSDVYKEFALSFKPPRQKNNMEESILDISQIPTISGKFTVPRYELKDFGYYTKEQVENACKSYKAVDSH